MTRETPAAFDMERIDARLDASDAGFDELCQAAEANPALTALGTLVAAIAHEFNGLLTPLHARAQRVLADPANHTHATALARHTLDASDRARVLIDAVLELSVDPSVSSVVAEAGIKHGGDNHVRGDPRSTVDDRIASHTNVESTIHPTHRSLASTHTGCDLRELSEAVVEELDPSLTASVSVRVDPVLTDCPTGAIHQILQNLVTNADQALRSDTTERDRSTESPTIWIAGGHGEAPMPSADFLTNDQHRWSSDTFLRGCSTGNIAEDRCWIMVGDSGPGIPEEIQERIFEPFFTTKSTSVDSEKPNRSTIETDGPGSRVLGSYHALGLGLGLSIVHGLVLRHGGSVTVHSRPNRGTVFAITLPGFISDINTGPADQLLH